MTGLERFVEIVEAILADLNFDEEK